MSFSLSSFLQYFKLVSCYDLLRVPAPLSVDFFPYQSKLLQAVVPFLLYVFRVYFSKLLPKLASYQNVALRFRKPAVSDGVNSPLQSSLRICIFVLKFEGLKPFWGCFSRGVFGVPKRFCEDPKGRKSNTSS